MRLPARRPDIHKFQAGRVLLVSGSRQYTGAARLAAEAALRSGCGMVYVAVPESIRSVVQSGLAEAIVVPVPETEGGSIAVPAIQALAPYLEKADAVALGPGLSTDEETAQFVRDLTKACTRPIVMDADGITAFAGRAEELGEVSAPLVLTPHSGELERLLGETLPADPATRVEKTREIAGQLGITLVHKGAPSMVASPEGDVWVSQHGNSALATGGTGDVLTGLVAGFIAQGAGGLDAARIGTTVHGRAGELAAERLGERSVIASDLFGHVGAAIQELEALREAQKRR